MDKLNELDTRDIEPTMHALGMTNVFRDDVVGGITGISPAISYAPKAGRLAFSAYE